MKIKRLLSAFLALLLFALPLASCGRTDCDGDPKDKDPEGATVLQHAVELAEQIDDLPALTTRNGGTVNGSVARHLSGGAGFSEDRSDPLGNAAYQSYLESGATADPELYNLQVLIDSLKQMKTHALTYVEYLNVFVQDIPSAGGDVPYGDYRVSYDRNRDSVTIECVNRLSFSEGYLWYWSVSSWYDAFGRTVIRGYSLAFYQGRITERRSVDYVEGDRYIAVLEDCYDPDTGEMGDLALRSLYCRDYTTEGSDSVLLAPGRPMKLRRTAADGTVLTLTTRALTPDGDGVVMPNVSLSRDERSSPFLSYEYDPVHYRETGENSATFTVDIYALSGWDRLVFGEKNGVLGYDLHVGTSVIDFYSGKGHKELDGGTLVYVMQTRGTEDWHMPTLCLNYMGRDARGADIAYLLSEIALAPKEAARFAAGSIGITDFDSTVASFSAFGKGCGEGFTDAEIAALADAYRLPTATYAEVNAVYESADKLSYDYKPELDGDGRPILGADLREKYGMAVYDVLDMTITATVEYRPTTNTVGYSVESATVARSPLLDDAVSYCFCIALTNGVEMHILETHDVSRGDGGLSLSATGAITLSTLPTGDGYTVVAFMARTVNDMLVRVTPAATLSATSADGVCEVGEKRYTATTKEGKLHLAVSWIDPEAHK